MDRLSALDVSFLHIEEADQSAHMHVASIGIFEGPAPDQSAIRQTLLDRLHLIPRYRQRVETVPFEVARPVWVDAADFDIDYHLRRSALSAPGSDEDLQALVGRIVSQRLDRAKPLWEIWIVEGLAGDQWAMIGKVHHCLVDGVSGAELLSTLLDFSADGAKHDAPEWEPSEPATGEVARDAIRSLVTDVGDQLRSVGHALRHPMQLVHEVGDVASGLRSMTGMIKPQDGSLTGSVGPHRLVAWTDASLDDIKTIRRGFGGTVNDVMLTAIANGFRELLIARGEDIEGRAVRTLVPVSTRATRGDGAAAGDGELNNKVSAIFATLPVGEADPVERLVMIRDEMNELKASGQVHAGDAVTTLGGHAPAALLSLGEKVLVRGVSYVPFPVETVTTNVPGPQLPLYCVGQEMVRLYPFVPVASPLTIGVAIFSYNGQVHFTVTGDRDSAPDIDVLATGIEDGLAELLRLAAVDEVHAP
jgi:WS/DGAT/MGAT family acyltransferase